MTAPNASGALSTQPCRLSVMLKTYNHEPYIAQAIESALAQRTTFAVEILIGEDCSTDRTREIVMAYAGRHPDRIRVLAHDSNLGMTGNTLALYGAGRGEYVAWLDGDDYWISPDKLQRQVQFLDDHPAHTMCCHEFALIVGNEGRPSPAPASCFTRSFGIEDLWSGRQACASSVVYRKVLEVFPPWFRTLPYADFPLQILHAQRGLAGWLPGILAGYRAPAARSGHRGYDSASGESFAKFCAKQQAVMYDTLNRHFDYRYDHQIRAAARRARMAWRVRDLKSRWPRLASPTAARAASRLAAVFAYLSARLARASDHRRS